MKVYVIVTLLFDDASLYLHGEERILSVILFDPDFCFRSYRHHINMLLFLLYVTPMMHGRMRWRDQAFFASGCWINPFYRLLMNNWSWGLLEYHSHYSTSLKQIVNGQLFRSCCPIFSMRGKHFFLQSTCLLTVHSLRSLWSLCIALIQPLGASIPQIQKHNHLDALHVK